MVYVLWVTVCHWPIAASQMSCWPHTETILCVFYLGETQVILKGGAPAIRFDLDH